MADIAHGGHGSALPDAHAAAHEHPHQRVYVEVAVVLLTITIIEVIIYYIQWMHDHGVIVPALLALSAVKFVTVVGMFMHLKFDDRRLTVIFAGAMFLSFATVMALYVLLKHHGINYTATGRVP